MTDKAHTLWGTASRPSPGRMHIRRRRTLPCATAMVALWSCLLTPLPGAAQNETETAVSEVPESPGIRAGSGTEQGAGPSGPADDAHPLAPYRARLRADILILSQLAEVQAALVAAARLDPDAVRREGRRGPTICAAATIAPVCDLLAQTVGPSSPQHSAPEAYPRPDPSRPHP